MDPGVNLAHRPALVLHLKSGEFTENNDFAAKGDCVIEQCFIHGENQSKDPGIDLRVRHCLPSCCLHQMKKAQLKVNWMREVLKF